MGPGFGRLAVSQVELPQAELRDGGAQGTFRGIGRHFLQHGHGLVESAHYLQTVQQGGVCIEKLPLIPLLPVVLHQVPADLQHAFLVSGVIEFGHTGPADGILLTGGVCRSGYQGKKNEYKCEHTQMYSFFWEMDSLRVRRG